MPAVLVHHDVGAFPRHVVGDLIPRQVLPFRPQGHLIGAARMLSPALDLHLVVVQRFPQGLGPLQLEQVEAVTRDGIPIALVKRRGLALPTLQQQPEHLLQPLATVAPRARARSNRRR